MPDPNDNTMLQLIPLPNNIDFIFSNNIITTKNNDVGYYIITSSSSIINNLVQFNNNSLSYCELGPFDMSYQGYQMRSIFSPSKIIGNIPASSWGRDGEFISISLPYKINLKKYTLKCLNNTYPAEFYVIGANITSPTSALVKNYTWYFIDYQNLNTPPANYTNDYLINPNLYNSFSTIVIVFIRSFSRMININKFYLYGTYGDNSCVCASDYYTPSGIITYDNGILNGCIAKQYITFYDNIGNKLKFLYDKNTKNYFYLYRTTSDTCAMDKAKNNINFIPTGFTTTFPIASAFDIVINIGALGGLGWFGGDVKTCTFSYVQILSNSDSTPNVIIKKTDYDFGIDLSQSFLIKYPDFQYSLYFVINNI
jgi:hypothetical protein